MKTNHYLSILLSALMLSAFTACDPKIDLDNIDPSAKLSLGLSVPVGDIHLTLGDFLGDSTTKYIYVDDQGVYHFRDTFNIDRDFHPIDLAQYFSSCQKDMMVKDKYPASELPASEFQLTFPMTLKLSEVNNDVEKERLDSMVITEANFTSYISVSDMNLKFSDIKKLEILLPANVHHNSGSVIEVPLTSGADWDDALPIILNDFTVDLIKDHSRDPGSTNVVDSLNFQFRFTLKPGAVVPITDNSKFTYIFTVNFLTYDALYGFFRESNKVVDKDTINIGHEWPTWNSIQHLKVPIAEPLVDIVLTTPVGAPLRAEIYQLWVVDSLYASKREAKFNNGTESQYIKPLENFVKVDDPFDTKATNHLIFDKNQGQLDKLFEIRPDVVCYDYALLTDQRTGVKQHRLLNDTKVDMSAVLDIPFKLNKGTDLSFSDTADVNISSISIDSLVADVKQIDSLNLNDIKLLLSLKSYIPFDIKGTFVFLDENNQKLPLEAAEGNTLLIPGPSVLGLQGRTPGTASLTIELDETDLDLLPKVKHILYELSITDMADNTKIDYPVSLSTHTALDVHVAVSAQAEAWFRLEFSENK